MISLHNSARTTAEALPWADHPQGTTHHVTLITAVPARAPEKEVEIPEVVRATGLLITVGLDLQEVAFLLDLTVTRPLIIEAVMTVLPEVHPHRVQDIMKVDEGGRDTTREVHLGNT